MTPFFRIHTQKSSIFCDSFGASFIDKKNVLQPQTFRFWNEISISDNLDTSSLREIP